MIKRALMLLIVVHLMGACAVVVKEGAPLPPPRPKEFQNHAVH